MRSTSTINLVVLGLAATTLVAAAPTPDQSCGHAPTVGTSILEQPVAEVMDLRDKPRDVVRLHLDDTGLSTGDVHGSWSHHVPVEEGATSLSPLAGQTRMATRQAPVVLEGTYVGKLHSFALHLFQHLPQENEARIDTLHVGVQIDGSTLWDGPIASVRRVQPVDCHNLYYGTHLVSFASIAEAMVARDLDFDAEHVLRLEISPAGPGAIPLVFDSHRTQSKLLANSTPRGWPVHELA